MKVKSNLSGVLDRTRRLKSHDIPAALAATLHPGRWRELALKEARSTLEALAGKDEREFIDDFLRTLTVDIIPGVKGFSLKMSTPFNEVQTIGDYQAARAVTKAYELAETLFQKQVQTFEDLMVEWVSTEKHKDRRDEGKSDEEIGHFISYLMLNPNPTPREMAARTKLTPHIVDFLRRKQEATRLEAAVIDLWLRSVLASWQRMVRDLFPSMFHEALLAARSQLALKAT